MAKQVPEKDRTAFGAIYKTIDDMCDAFGMSSTTYKNRMRTGKYTIEQALVLPVNKRKHNEIPEKDRTAFGVVYKSIKSMCDAFSIPRATYDSRMKLGKCTIEQALSKPVKGSNDKIPEKDRTAFGVVYDTIKSMCDAFSIPRTTYDSRMKTGKYTIEKALVLPVKNNKIPEKDRTAFGVTYDTIEDMCDAFNISRKVYRYRMKSGNYTIEQALTKPVKK